MKKIVVLFSVIASLMMAATAARAETTVRLRVKVPFSFIVDNAELPAGAYEVELTSSPMAGAFSSVAIRNRNGELAAFTFMRQEADPNAKKGALLFTKSGRTYTLSAVSNDGYSSVVRLGRAEQELADRHISQVATVAAVN